ncbi:MAG: Potassium-transporting ATPase A chain [Syntrophorhabdaceae bacterium PtaU1.Bin034]|nr:MAG: Potassium-transporting ATPase A chain [Syntrophorhabdaceae bacterium PtaU1.Bin034]
MAQDIMYIVVFLAVVMLLAPFLGRYMAAVFEGRRTMMSSVLRPVEAAIYRLCRIDENAGMTWKEYSFAFLLFNGIGLIVLFALQLVQGRLPFNPQGLGAVRWDTALNTAISFVTNTNWQAYGGESTMSYLTQMMGMTVQNFLSAAAGMAALLPLIRGFVYRIKDTVGNFWVDMTRSLLYVLLPLSLLLAFLLVSQGVVQTFGPYVRARTLEGGEQVIAVGPAASQIAIKQLGSNGGGFFNANAAHPFENPTPFCNAIEVVAILLIPAALPFTFGRMIGNRRQGRAIFAAMAVLFLVGLGIVMAAEWRGNPALTKLGITDGINMEGKEVRFGVGQSVLWGQSTTATSNGSVNSMHDSAMPLTGLVYMFNMAVGEVIFGGVGVGMIGMLMYAILALFLAGLMIGRTPEFLGKKLESREMIMAVIVVVAPAISSLIFSGIAAATRTGLGSLHNAGPHGLSEILYAFFSCAGNNGSAFAGLNANTPFYNLAGGFVMLVGRFATILPAFAIAGSLVMKKAIPPGSATFPTASPLFTGMLTGTVIIVGALTFFPALVLGPVLEHLLVIAGRAF